MKSQIKPFSKGKNVNAIIETPKGSQNKYSYIERNGCFKLHKVLPSGTAFPFDFGFIPGTKGQDGDPIDIIVLMEDITYPGCLVECRLIGVIEALKKEKNGKEVRNDRIVAVPVCESETLTIKTLKDLDKHKLNHFIEFLKYYNKLEGIVFTLLDIKGPKKAMSLIKKNLT